MHCDGFKIQIHIKLRKKQLFYIAFHITIDLVLDQFVFKKKQQSTILVKEKVFLSKQTINTFAFYGTSNT